MVISRLLDTNTVAELAKNLPNESVIEQIKRHDQELAIASVVWHELLYGWYRMPDGKKKMLIGDFIKQVVSVLPIIDYDAKAGRIHAELRASLESKGRPLPFADGQIASIAIANGLTLVTRNTKDFDDISGLSLENWFS